jgi:hypothetical protein
VSGKEARESGWPPYRPELTQREYYFGVPNPSAPGDTAMYESEADYLDRLNLLTQEERHAIAVAQITHGETA